MILGRNQQSIGYNVKNGKHFRKASESFSFLRRLFVRTSAHRMLKSQAVHDN